MGPMNEVKYVQVDCHPRLFHDEHFANGGVRIVVPYVPIAHLPPLISPPWIFAAIAATINARHAGKQTKPHPQKTTSMSTN